MASKLGDILQAEFDAGRRHRVRLAGQGELGEFAPGTNCHDNAASYAAINPEYEVIQGWIADTMRFTRHSVVKNRETGELVCVTFGSTRKHVGPFIVHDDAWIDRPYKALDNQISPRAIPDGA
jgi:hypothetical protein